MALTDQVIMPGSDYQAICDKVRNLTGKTGTLKSGDIPKELGTITPGVDLPVDTVLTETIDDGVLHFKSQLLYHTLIVTNSTKSVYITGIVGSMGTSTYSTACHSYDSIYNSVSSTALVVSYQSSTQLYSYTWNVASSSSASFYEGTLIVYGIL